MRVCMVHTGTSQDSGLGGSTQDVIVFGAGIPEDSEVTQAGTRVLKLSIPFMSSVLDFRYKEVTLFYH